MLGRARHRQHLVGDAPVRAVDELVELDEAARPLDVPRRERVERDPHHLLGPLAHLRQPLDEVVPRLELGRELGQLRDRDALVADPLEVDRVVQDREHEPEVGRDGRLLREQLLDRLLDPVVARVDLVVERDDLVAQLDVLRAGGR